MKIQDGTVVLGERECVMCRDGKTAGRIQCRTCRGTGRGAKGGRNGCKRCNGSRIEFSADHPVTCGRCKGKGRVPETLTDYIDHADWQALEFRVYRQDREISGNESLLGLGCAWSCMDYGEAWERNDDAALIHHVRVSPYGIQACKIADDNGNVCDHVGIFVSRGGYSLRAVFAPDGSDAKSRIDRERPRDEYLRVGSAMAEAGMNGTIGALLRN